MGGWDGNSDSDERSYLMDHTLPMTAFSSKFEVLDNGVTYMDYKTAHTRVGDPLCTTWLPESCYKCWQQKLSAEEAGWFPTRPDQEMTDDDAA